MGRPRFDMNEEGIARRVGEGRGRRPRTRARQRLADMLSFFELMTEWYDSTRRMSTAAVLRFVKLGDKVARMLGVNPAFVHAPFA